jgi:hypothetical protein
VSCLHVYADRDAPLLAEMRADLEEFLETSAISGAGRLTTATGQQFPLTTTTSATTGRARTRTAG